MVRKSKSIIKSTSKTIGGDKTDRNDTKKSANRFPIVGIGASAGGLEAVKEVLRSLSSDTGMAFVLIQHLDPTHESLTREILSRTTDMPVSEVTDGMRVAPNNVYVIPPKFGMSLLNGILVLHPLSAGPRGQSLVIDSFFQSLALDQKGRAIGVILSGTASDGTSGLKAIKSEGGLTIAQDPKSAKYSGMPESAIASGVVDLILPPIEIAQELTRISNHPYVAKACEVIKKTDDKPLEDEKPRETVEPEIALRKIFVLLRTSSKVDFSNYKRSTIRRRIQRRMMVCKARDIDSYATYLQNNPNEVKILYADILIHVTEFFREPESFKILQNVVFPKLIKNRKSNSPIRIWVPGCSTGEEAYSIALLLLEFLNKAGTRIPIQIFATDISDQAIQKARAGIYSQAIESVVSEHLLDTYFVKVEGGYKINKAVRDLCLFSRHDITNDPPFSKLDLVSCRNVLIYFGAVLQKRVIPIFHYALNPGGFLFLGKSESLGQHSKLFSLVDKTHKIYSRADAPTPMTLRAPLLYDADLQSATEKPSVYAKTTLGYEMDAQRVALARYAPPSVIINADMEILRFQGRTAPYLEPSHGQPSNNLLKMARSELVQGLRTAVKSALKKNGPARLEALSFKTDGKRRRFNIEVIPINPSKPPAQRNFIVFFEEISVTASPERPKKISPGKQAQWVSQLEKDLADSKDDRKTLTEEFEAAQEELTSANEELQSTNEELQSANEELETSKEELQSSNEELTTVNDELQTRNTELTALSSDLNNVLNNVETPIIIVGNDRRIRKFTPKAEKFFNLISSDIGRFLTDIKPNFESDLETLVSKTINSLLPQESEVRIKDNQWMRLQVRPYRTLDNRIDGAVITLTDITALKYHLIESQNALKYANSVADTLKLPLVVLDENLELLSANLGFSRMFKIDPSNKVGSNIFSILGEANYNTPRLRQSLSEVIGKDQPLMNFEMEYDFPEIGRRIFLLNARQINWQESMPRAMLLSLDDITDRRLLERSVEQSEERFRSVIESAHDAIIIVSKGIIEFANPRAFASFGYAPGELEGKPLDILLPERFRRAHAGYHESYVATPKARPMGAGVELFGKRKDGTEIPVDISLTPIKTGRETKITAIIRDVSVTRRLSEERKTLLEQEKAARTEANKALVEAKAANETKDVFLATLSHELRTPLTSILSYAQLLQLEKPDSDKIKRGLQTIEQSAKAQGQLIDDLLDISRIQSGKLSISFTDVDPREAISLAVAAVGHLAENKQIKIETELSLNSEVVWGDLERLQQIVWNLLTNAIKFSSKGDKIQVRVEPFLENGKKGVSIKVIDHGKGIDSDFLPKLFERFSQADSSSIRIHGGLGLGLALVRDLTQLQGGTVKAESEGLGKGATFTVRLPAKAGTTHIEAKDSFHETFKPGIVRPDLSGLRVMIVEDDPSTMDALNETLKSFGAKTIQCVNAAQALALFTESKPDVLVSDVAMPGEDGYSLMRKIRELGASQNGHLPSLALTAYAKGEDVKRALSAGFTFHMAKPFDNLELGLAIEKLKPKA